MLRLSYLSEESVREETEIVRVNDLDWHQRDHFNEDGQMIYRVIMLRDAEPFDSIVRDGWERRRADGTTLQLRAVSVNKREVAEIVTDPADDLRAAGMTDMQIAAFEFKHDIDLSPKVEKMYEDEIMYQVIYKHGTEMVNSRRWSNGRYHDTIMSLDKAMKFCNKFLKRYTFSEKDMV